MEKPTITTFTDPMMGLSYQSEPFFRQLETHYPNQLNFKTVMGGLVQNVYDWLDSEELNRLGEKQAIERYNQRLAKIYESEQGITGLPIKMLKLDLFSPERTSSLPLNLAYKAVELTEKAKAETFLYYLRYATIVDVRPTTDLAEILNVVRQTGIDEQRFLQHYQNGSAQRQLDNDLAYKQRLGVRGLPAYLFEYADKCLLINGVLNFEQFSHIISQLSNGQLHPQKPTINEPSLKQFLQQRALISVIEIQYAFALATTTEARTFLAPLVANKEWQFINHDFLARVKGGFQAG